MACTANTNSIDLAINTGVLTADLVLDPAVSNGLTVSGSGVKAPSNVTSDVTTATVSGTSMAFAAGNSGPMGPVLQIPTITNPSLDRTMVGIFVVRSTGEIINFAAGSSAQVDFQVSDDGGTTWSTQDQTFYNAVPGGTSGNGCHMASGIFGPIAANSAVGGGTLRLRMFLSCSVGSGNVLNSGDLDARIFMVNQ